MRRGWAARSARCCSIEGQRDQATDWVHPEVRCESKRPQGGLRAAARSRGQRGPGKQAGATLLFIASQDGHKEVARCCSIEANVDQAKQDGTTPLFMRVTTATRSLALLLIRGRRGPGHRMEQHRCRESERPQGGLRAAADRGARSTDTRMEQHRCTLRVKGHKEVCARRRSTGRGPTSTRPSRVGVTPLYIGEF